MLHLPLKGLIYVMNEKIPLFHLKSKKFSYHKILQLEISFNPERIR